MEGEDLGGRGTPLERGVPLPPNLHSLRELPPRAPAFSWQRVVSFRMVRVLLGESFCRLGRHRVLAKCGCRACLVCGVRSDITPYTSAGHSIVGNDPCVVPVQLNVTCRSVLCYGRRRLILPYKRHTLSLRLPPTKQARQPHFAKNYLPKHKNFPHVPATLKKRNKFSLRKWRDMGEVLGERGRFGGREPPLRKRGLSPSEVFPCASHSQNERDSRTLQQVRTSPINKKLPP